MIFLPSRLPVHISEANPATILAAPADRVARRRRRAPLARPLRSLWPTQWLRRALRRCGASCISQARRCGVRRNSSRRGWFREGGSPSKRLQPTERVRVILERSACACVVPAIEPPGLDECALAVIPAEPADPPFGVLVRALLVDHRPEFVRLV